jgi:hypothetical protein
MKDRFIIIRATRHGRSEYRRGKWMPEGSGHIYGSLQTAFRSHKKIVEAYPAYKDIVTIARV